ncbi:MAG: TlpA family protein disulfide reductase [Lachnospiraceae bacterium]|nr:TlpA family protein disulfide reductase [Lachnospiraceae bacterium]
MLHKTIPGAKAAALAAVLIIFSLILSSCAEPSGPSASSSAAPSGPSASSDTTPSGQDSLAGPATVAAPYGQGSGPVSPDVSGSNENSNAASSNTAAVNIPPSEISDTVFNFNTSLLNGERVNRNIFSDYDLTLVLVWGTYCQTCIAEMGNYAALYKDLPDNINIISVAMDVSEGDTAMISAAKSILTRTGAGFPTLLNNREIAGFLKEIRYLPSSFFVDRDGHLLGRMGNGAGFRETVGKLEGYLV